MLSEQSGLKVRQVTIWFYNMRQRHMSKQGAGKQLDVSNLLYKRAKSFTEPADYDEQHALDQHV